MPLPDCAALEHQLSKYEAAIVEFTAIEAELRRQPVNARVADLIRLNRETINSIERSAELVRMRISTLRDRSEVNGSSSAASW